MASLVKAAFVTFVFVLCFGFLLGRSIQDGCVAIPDILNAFTPSGDSFSEGQLQTYRCRPGYQRRGDNRIRCTNNQWQWLDLDRPFVCRIVRCPQPPDVSHGLYRGNDYAFGNTMTLICDDGYRVVSNSGLQTIICQPNGRWTVISATCQVVRCQELSAPQHGTMTLFSGSSSRSVGTIYAFECDNQHQIRGYRARERLERRCLPDGTWTNVTAECIDIECLVLDHLENGRVRSDGNMFGDAASFTCKSGFVMRPSHVGDISYCQRNGRWSIPLPECKPDHCGPLPDKANTKPIYGNRFNINDRKYIECNAGYTRRGSSWMECTYDGWVWESPRRPFSCQENCKAPGTMDVAHVKAEDTGTYSVGHQVNMECQEAYSQRGSNAVVCMEQPNPDGTVNPIWIWEDLTYPFECLEKCEHPTHLDHIKQVSKMYDVDTILNIECDKDYSAPQAQDYNNRLKCTKGKRWTPLNSQYPLLSCHANCRETPRVAHSIRKGITTTFPIGSQVSVDCVPGYESRGNNELTCTTSGWRWKASNDRFDCVKKVTATAAPAKKGRAGHCKRPNAQQKVIHFYKKTPLSSLTGEEFEDFPTGTTLTCVCSSPGEMFMEGSASHVNKKDVHCLYSGYWDHYCICNMIPRLVEEIPRIKIRQKFKVLSSGAVYSFNKTTNIFDCEYILERYSDYDPLYWGRPHDNNYRYVFESAGESGYDLLPNRPDITRSNHTLRVSRRFRGGTPDGRYTCNKGLIFNSEPYTRTYSNFLDLVTQDPYQYVCCPSQGDLVHGTTTTVKGEWCDASSSDYKTGTKLKFQCKTGYGLDGNEFTYCLNDGTWSNPRPNCIQTSCQGLPNIKHAVPLSRSPKIVTMKCARGYTAITGTDRWKCVRGSWVMNPQSEGPLRCEKDFCDGRLKDRTCSVFERGYNVTIQETLFTGGVESRTYYLEGATIVNRCPGTSAQTTAWTCVYRKWTRTSLCFGYPQRLSSGNANISPPTYFVTNGGGIFLSGAPVRDSTNGKEWICTADGQWSLTRFCTGLPQGHDGSCLSIVSGQNVSSSGMWTEPLPTVYYTAKSLLSSTCGTTEPTKWLCEGGSWQQWTNCSSLPDPINDPSSRLRLEESESAKSQWQDGEIIKATCESGYSLPQWSDDSWKCVQSRWELVKKSRIGHGIPECEKDQTDYDAQDETQFCDTYAITNGIIKDADYGSYDANDNTVFEVECNDSKTVHSLSCINGTFHPDPNQICLY